MKTGNTGEHTETLRTSEVDDDVNVVNVIEDRLQNLHDIVGPQSKEAPESDDDDPNSDGPKASDDQNDGPNPNDGKKGDDADKDVMPDVYVQAAVRSGWKQEEIDELVEKDSKLAEKIFGNLYLSVNQLSREYSALGRARNNVAPNKVDTKPEEKVDFKDIDLKALKDEYGDTPIIDGVVKPLNDTLKRIVDKLNSTTTNTIVESHASNVNAEFDTISDGVMQQRLNNFFESDPMKVYDDFYGKLEVGKDVRNLNVDQRRHRWDVITEADAICAGYAVSNRYISPEEALIRAHLMITEPVREKMIRNDIKTTMVKRNKSLTLRPSESTKTGSGSAKFGGNKPRSREELVTSVDEKMRNIFGN